MLPGATGVSTYFKVKRTVERTFCCFAFWCLLVFFTSFHYFTSFMKNLRSFFHKGMKKIMSRWIFFCSYENTITLFHATWDVARYFSRIQEVHKLRHIKLDFHTLCHDFSSSLNLKLHNQVNIVSSLKTTPNLQMFLY